MFFKMDLTYRPDFIGPCSRRAGNPRENTAVQGVFFLFQTGRNMTPGIESWQLGNLNHSLNHPKICLFSRIGFFF